MNCLFFPSLVEGIPQPRIYSQKNRMWSCSCWNLGLPRQFLDRQSRTGPRCVGHGLLESLSCPQPGKFYVVFSNRRTEPILNIIKCSQVYTAPSRSHSDFYLFKCLSLAMISSEVVKLNMRWDNLQGLLIDDTGYNSASAAHYVGDFRQIYLMMWSLSFLICKMDVVKIASLVTSLGSCGKIKWENENIWHIETTLPTWCTLQKSLGKSMFAYFNYPFYF